MIKKVNPNYIVKKFTDLYNTPDTLTNGKILKTNSSGEGVDFKDYEIGTYSADDLKLDYITGFSMQSFGPDINGYHEKINISKGILEIAEPGDFTNNGFWDFRISKMIMNCPLRFGQNRDISGYYDDGYGFFMRRYNSTYSWLDRPQYFQKDGDMIYRTHHGVNSNFFLKYQKEYDYNSTGKLTISMRVRFRNLNDGCIVSDYFNNGSGTIYPKFITDFENGKFRIIAYSGSGYIIFLWNNTQPQNNIWYHILVEIDVFNSVANLWLDGVLQTLDSVTDTRDLGDKQFWENNFTGFSYVTIGGLFYFNNEKLIDGDIKSVVMFNRYLTETERNYLINNEYITRTLNETPGSDIYELDNDKIIDTENISADLMGDGTPSTLEERWYYIYAVASANNKCVIKVSWYPPNRNRFNVENEGFSAETLYHPFLNARCIGVFKYKSVCKLDPNKSYKVIRFKMVNGFYQALDVYQILRGNSTSYNFLFPPFEEYYPTNIYRYRIRYYSNCQARGLYGMNSDRTGYLEQKVNSTSDTYNFSYADLYISNNTPTLVFKLLDTSSDTTNDKWVITDFSFKQ